MLRSTNYDFHVCENWAVQMKTSKYMYACKESVQFYLLNVSNFDWDCSRPVRYFPFGIVFLVAGKILEMSDPSAMGKKLGFYAITVVFGLVLHGLFILPAMYFFITKKSPIVYIRGILQALLIALATSSR